METCGGASGAALETTRHNGANDDAKLVGVQLGNVHYITSCSAYLPRHILYYSRVFRCHLQSKSRDVPRTAQLPPHETHGRICLPMVQESFHDVGAEGVWTAG